MIAGVPQGFVLGPPFFLVYINDLPDDLNSDAKLFANDTSLFTTVYDENIAAEQLNNDLKIISEWSYKCKMQFNPDKAKQAVHVTFSCVLKAWVFGSKYFFSIKSLLLPQSIINMV